MDAAFNLNERLLNWNVKDEQNRADFLDYLYEFYNCTDGYYTGLYQRFMSELSQGLIHDLFVNDREAFDALKDRVKLSGEAKS